MQMTVTIGADIYEGLRKQPLFFVKFYKNIYTDENGREHDCSEWRSVNASLSISFPAQNFGDREKGYCLCLAESATFVQKQGSQGYFYTDESIVKMLFRDVYNSVQDYIHCLNSCICRAQNKDDKYYFLEILWLLDNTFINADYLTEAIKRYDDRSIPYILDILRKIGHCLSVKKQYVLKKVCTELNGQYEVYMPKMLTEAIQYLKINTDSEKKDLFQLIDKLLEEDFCAGYTKTIGITSNPLLQLVSWFSNDEKLADYQILPRLFVLVPEQTRLEIVKRYFHDIRLGNTTFDVQLLKQFVDNRYNDFIRYRYCTETPSDKIILTVPLLCDNIITLYKSNGTSFQTFDGILDFAMTHCDQAHPDINFDLARIIPTCEHSAVYNPKFKGFIDYQLIRKIELSKLNDDALLFAIRNILDRYGHRDSYPVCKYDNNKKIEMNILQKCKSAFLGKQLNGVSQQNNTQCTGIEYKLYDDKWIIHIDDSHTQILETFTPQGASFRHKDEICYVDIHDVSIDRLRQYVVSLIAKFQKVGENEIIIPSYKNETYDMYLIGLLSEIVRIRIIPQNGALVGQKYDVFGYWKEIYATLSDEKNRNPKSEGYKKALLVFKEKESNEVYRRTVASLKKELNEKEYNGEYFEFKYDRHQLIKLIGRYYFKETLKDDDDYTRRNFLTASYTNNFKPYCAPTLSEANNPVIDLPFFWCRGKECFHNNLANQTIAEQNDWHYYSLYHMVEIIGFKMLHMTAAGYEPDSVVRNFIAVTNKAMQKFKRLKCRGCGHLMFTDKGSGFNRHNYYSCINPICPESRIPVYLSYCYKCKKGLIDSRDTKRCPNNWYICPTCLSCCDDEQYERQAQRYIISNRPVPERIERMRRHGHNDKGEYFCPKCGSLLEQIQDDHGYKKILCPNCKQTYNDIM